MKTKTIRQNIKFPVAPKQVYQYLTDAKLYATFTGGPVQISEVPGKKLSVFGGYITGKTIASIPGKSLIQEMHFKEADWPETHVSIATFTLKKIEGGTQLQFVHSEVPESSYENLKKGWHTYYWKPMKRMMKQGN